MILPRWDALPDSLRVAEVRPYYDQLYRKRFQLVFKHMFDLLASATLIVLLSPVLAVVSYKIYKSDKGPVYFRQRRVTTLGREFFIFKFRTMVMDAQARGPQLTMQNDTRITPIGKKLRARRLDEIPQLFNIFRGEMSFVGTRPEVPHYVEQYTPEMMATLLMPAGLTSSASVTFKDEDEVHAAHPDMPTDEVYIQYILPKKMELNLNSIANFSLWSDFHVLLDTLRSVLLKS